MPSVVVKEGRKRREEEDDDEEEEEEEEQGLFNGTTFDIKVGLFCFPVKHSNTHTGY